MRISPSLLPRVATQIAVLLTLMSSRGVAQATADSSGRARAADSAASGYGDSARRSGVDTSRVKPAAEPLKGAKPAPDSAAPVLPTARAVPTDTVLSSACSSARPGTLAPGLLLVLFRDSATEKERAAAMTTAGGVPAGRAPEGGDYVRPSSDTTSSRDLADRLVQDPAVAAISERTCPVAR
jgi:hypothetical protein